MISPFLAAEATNPWWVTLIAGVAGVVIVLLALGVRRGQRGRGHEASNEPLREDLDQAVAELGDLTNRLASLIEQADERIEVLRGLTPAEKIANPPLAELPIDSTPAADPLVRRVCELADAGRDSVQIAQELDEHVGKVELILALRTQTTEM